MGLTITLSLAILPHFFDDLIAPFLNGQMFSTLYQVKIEKLAHFREEKSEYLPLFSVDHEPLVDYLEKSGILSKTKPVPKTSYKPLRKFLKLVRKTARKFNPEATVWTATWVLLSFTIFF